MAFLSEAQLETALLEQMVTLGLACVSDEIIGPDGKHPEREAYDEAVLKARLTAAVARLNPALPPEAQADAIRRLTQSELPNLLEENRRIHRLLSEGADVEFYGDDGVLTAGKVRLIDFDHPANAGYHQFHAVKKAVISTLRASRTNWQAEDPAEYGLPSVDRQPAGDHKAGVIWHTQGSGKSLLMAFYAGLLVFDPRMANPTLVVLTDRNDLDDQLFATFAMCKDLLRQTPVQAQDREHLRTLLNRASGGVIFTTIQKFAPVGAGLVPALDEATTRDRATTRVAPTVDGATTFTRVAPTALTDRANVVVIADEAHRSQYGFRAKVASKTGEIAYGFAKYLRDALPNASFIGFTGTPIKASDVNTSAVFGHYIDIYDISRAVEDGATVPIYYESRLARIELDEDEKPRIDAEIEALLEDEDAPSAERTKQKWSTVEALVGSDKRLALVAADLVQHFEDRVAALDGKAMVACMSRRICVALYDAIIRLRPDWHSSDDNAGSIKIVMTGAASDPVAWQQHIGGSSGQRARRDLLAKRAKNPVDPLRL